MEGSVFGAQLLGRVAGHPESLFVSHTYLSFCGIPPDKGRTGPELTQQFHDRDGERKSDYRVFLRDALQEENPLKASYLESSLRERDRSRPGRSHGAV
jgi:hypothetical protein